MPNTEEIYCHMLTLEKEGTAVNYCGIFIRLAPELGEEVDAESGAALVSGRLLVGQASVHLLLVKGIRPKTLTRRGGLLGWAPRHSA
jgi:hypothetical protein